MKVQFVPGTHPIPALACPVAAELGFPSSRSYGYVSQSNPALNDNCPALSLGMLMQYAGYP